MAKKLLKVAAGINLVIGGLVLLFSLLIINLSFIGIIGAIGSVVGAVRLAIGAMYLNVANKDGEEFFRERGPVLAVSIISLLTGHFVTFILGIIAYTDMYREIPLEGTIKRELTEEEKTQKRLRNLLALGCSLVLLAGIIFAMTTWTTLSGPGKTIALVGATVIFFGLSYFSEKKFKLKSSAVTYYVLANAFCAFAFVAAGYFNIFGNWFSLNGAGESLYKAFLFLLIALLTYLGYLKYDKKDLFYLLDLALLGTLIFVFDFFNIRYDIVLFIITTIIAVFALAPVKNEIIKKTNELASMLLPIASFMLFTFGMSMKDGDRIIFNLLTFAIAFVSNYYLAISNKGVFYEIFSPIFTIGTAFALSAVVGADSKLMFLQLMLITVIVYIIGYYRREQKWLFNATSIICDFALLYILIDALNMEYSYYAIAAGIALLGTSIAVMVSRKFNEYHFEALLEPIKVIVLSYTIYKLIYKFEYSEEALFLALVGLIFAVVCIFRKDFMKKLYFIGSVLLALWAVLTNAREFAPIAQSLSCVSLAILLFVTFRTKDVKFGRCKELIYGLLLVGIALASLNSFSYFDLKLIGIILLTIIYSVLFIVFNKNDVLRCFTIVALLIPYVVILPISIWNDNINYILYSLPWLVLVFIYTRGFLATASLKVVNIIEIIFLSIWYLAVSSQISLEVAIFIGVISFVALLIGYKSEKWSSLYYTGVAFLILNTLIQLKEFWTSIPIWAYILVMGLILIGIVTYKEYSRVNKKECVEKVEAEIIEEKKVIPAKQVLDTRAIVAGSVLYLVFIPILLQVIL